MHPTAVKAYSEIKAAHAKVYPQLKSLLEDIKNVSDIDTQADTAYAMRELVKYSDDITKLANNIKEVSEKITCALWVKDSTEPNIKTPYCTATPDVKIIASLPTAKKDPEAYNNFMAHFGIPSEALAADIVRPHWPGMMEHISNLAAEGKPLPPGIDPEKTYPKYGFKILRGRKKVDDAGV